MRIYLAGRITVERNGRLLLERQLPGPQGRHVFAMLAAEHRRPLSRDELAEELWSARPPEAWDNAIRLLVHKIRAALSESLATEGSIVSTDRSCYQLLLLPPDGWLDLDAARSSVNHAESSLALGDVEAAHAEANVACAIARRPFLPGLDGPWLRERQAELTAQRVRALECMSEVWLRRGDLKQAAHFAQLAIRSDPYADGALRQLMHAHLAAGEKARAIKAFEDHSEFLLRELGIRPTKESEEVYRALVSPP